jgi:hypothetical protein
MRQEWIMETKNEDDLLYSMDEVLNSPDAGKIIVGTNTEYAIEAKAPEHAAINEIIAILFTKGRLQPKDVQSGMLDVVEFIDAFVCDSPHAFEYVGEMLATLLHIKALSIPWLYKAASNIANDPDKCKLIDHALEAMSKYGDEAVHFTFGGASERTFEQLLAPNCQIIAQKL